MSLIPDISEISDIIIDDVKWSSGLNYLYYNITCNEDYKFIIKNIKDTLVLKNYVAGKIENCKDKMQRIKTIEESLTKIYITYFIYNPAILDILLTTYKDVEYNSEYFTIKGKYLGDNNTPTSYLPIPAKSMTRLHGIGRHIHRTRLDKKLKNVVKRTDEKEKKRKREAREARDARNEKETKEAKEKDDVKDAKQDEKKKDEVKQDEKKVKSIEKETSKKDIEKKKDLSTAISQLSKKKKWAELEDDDDDKDTEGKIRVSNEKINVPLITSVEFESNESNNPAELSKSKPIGSNKEIDEIKFQTNKVIVNLKNMYLKLYDNGNNTPLLDDMMKKIKPWINSKVDEILYKAFVFLKYLSIDRSKYYNVIYKQYIPWKECFEECDVNKETICNPDTGKCVPITGLQGRNAINKWLSYRSKYKLPDNIEMALDVYKDKIFKRLAYNELFVKNLVREMVQKYIKPTPALNVTRIDIARKLVISILETLYILPNNINKIVDPIIIKYSSPKCDTNEVLFTKLVIFNSDGKLSYEQAKNKLLDYKIDCVDKKTYDRVLADYSRKGSLFLIDPTNPSNEPLLIDHLITTIKRFNDDKNLLLNDDEDTDDEQEDYGEETDTDKSEKDTDTDTDEDDEEKKAEKENEKLDKEDRDNKYNKEEKGEDKDDKKDNEGKEDLDDDLNEDFSLGEKQEEKVKKVTQSKVKAVKLGKGQEGAYHHFSKTEVKEKPRVVISAISENMIKYVLIGCEKVIDNNIDFTDEINLDTQDLYDFILYKIDQIKEDKTMYKLYGFNLKDVIVQYNASILIYKYIYSAIKKYILFNVWSVEQVNNKLAKLSAGKSSIYDVVNQIKNQCLWLGKTDVSLEDVRYALMYLGTNDSKLDNLNNDVIDPSELMQRAADSIDGLFRDYGLNISRKDLYKLLLFKLLA